MCYLCPIITDGVYNTELQWQALHTMYSLHLVWQCNHVNLCFNKTTLELPLMWNKPKLDNAREVHTLEVGCLNASYRILYFTSG